MSADLMVSCLDGKYTVVHDENGLNALRHGEPWRELTGDNLVYGLAFELQDARAALQPFSELLQSHHTELKDDCPIFGIGDKVITVGHLREAFRITHQAPKPPSGRKVVEDIP